MGKAKSFDAIVVGAGTNGLSAAITLARAGLKVLIRESAPTVGGSSRSAELTLPGFTHDICSTIQAMAPVSAFFKSVPLADFGLSFVEPPAAFAHPLDDGTAAIAYRSLLKTTETLGIDAAAWEQHFEPLVSQSKQLMPDLLAPLGVPAHPILMARFGMSAIQSAAGLARNWFQGEPARALFAGVAAHSIIPFEWRASAAIGLVLTVAAHVGGWPLARGGSQKLADALAACFRLLGGTIETNSPVKSIDELSDAKAILCDVSPRQLVRIAGNYLPENYRRRLERFQYGPGIWKVDWALNGPIPWNAPACREAATVHIGGTLDEIALAERAPWLGQHAERPYVLLVQPTLFDPTRAPAGKHIAWAYCHVPNSSTVDMTDRIEAQIERFATGFKDRILETHTMSAADMESQNPNLIGGDISGGANMLSQMLTRPVAKLNPYETPIRGLYICSASTPPGGGIHGMCGYWAAKSALKREFRSNPATL